MTAHNVSQVTKKRHAGKARTSGNDVLVGDENSLGCTSRSRGIHNTSKILRTRRVGGDGLAFSQSEEFIKGVNLDSGIGSLDSLDRTGLDILGGSVIDDHLESGCLLDDGCDGAQEGSVGEDSIHFGLVDRVLELHTRTPSRQPILYTLEYIKDVSREGLTPSSPRES